MVRPEQIELVAEGRRRRREGGGALTFYGPDTIVELALDGVASPISARVLRGHDCPAPGTPVGLRVVGPVMAYRAGPTDAGGDPGGRAPVSARLLAAAAAVAALAVAMAGCGGTAPNTIVLYNGQHPQLTSALVSAFTHQTGIHVSVRTGDGIVLADQILQEGSNSPADVYLTENSPELMNLQQHGLLAKLPASIIGQVPAARRLAGRRLGRHRAAGLEPRLRPGSDVPASQLPASVLQLEQPQWQGRIAIAPTDSDFVPLVGAIIADRRRGRRGDTG